MQEEDLTWEWTGDDMEDWYGPFDTCAEAKAAAQAHATAEWWRASRLGVE